MTEARVGTPADAVTGDWLSIERSTTTKPEGVIATVVVTSAAPTPVGVRVRQELPDAWAVTGVSVHPDFEPPEFTAAADAIDFADVVYPEERRRFVYGIRVDTTDGLEPLADPVIVEERQLEDGIGQPDDDDGIPTDHAADPSGAGEGPTADLWDDAGPDDLGAEPAASPDDEEPDGADDPAVEPAIDDGPAPFDEPSASPGAGDDVPDRPEDDPDPVGPDAPPDPTADDAGDPAVENGLRDGVDGGIDAPTDPPGTDADAVTEHEDADTAGVAGDGGLLEAPEAVLEETANLLVLADHDEASAGCSRLLDRQIGAGDELVLVTFAESADDRLEVVTGLATAPGSIDLLCMGDPQRSAGDGSTVSTPAGEVAVTAIADATDLFRLGVHISRALDEATGDPVLCFHSLTALVGLVELHRVFRFLHVLSGRVRGAEARAHYHLDPSVIDERTYGTLGHLFDDVVRFADGHWAVD